MEKRRRARINSSLNDLKTLVLESMKKDVSSYLYHYMECTSQGYRNKKIKKTSKFLKLKYKKL